jgi:hypothetical protein
MPFFPMGVDEWIEALTSQVFTSQPAITVIVGAAAVFLSATNLIYPRKQLKLRGLVEVVRDLHLPSHREARRIVYEGRNAVTTESYGILGLAGELGEDRNVEQVLTFSENIVREDMNNAAMLIRHGLMNKSIFLEEYWWIVLRSWDSLEESISARRKKGDGASNYMQSLQYLKDDAETYASKHHSNDFADYKKEYRSKGENTASNK